MCFSWLRRSVMWTCSSWVKLGKWNSKWTSSFNQMSLHLTISTSMFECTLLPTSFLALQPLHSHEGCGCSQTIPGKRIIEVILGHNRWLQKSIRLFGQRKGLAASISSWHCLNVCDIWREAHGLCHSWDIHIKPLTYFWLIVWHKHIRVLTITDYPNNPLNSKFLLLVISENVRPNKLQNLLTTKNVKKFFNIQLLSHSGSMTFIASHNLQD